MYCKNNLRGHASEDTGTHIKATQLQLHFLFENRRTLATRLFERKPMKKFIGLLLVGLAMHGAVSTDVIVPITGDSISFAQFRGSSDPVTHVAELLGIKPESSAFLGIKEDAITPFCQDEGVLSAVLKKVYEKNGGLSLSPDVLLYLISSKIAEHVVAEGERYREKFTTAADGKETIVVIRNDFILGANNPWNEVLPQFFQKLLMRMPSKGLTSLFEPQFSTTDLIDAACGYVVLMKAGENFLQYVVRTKALQVSQPSITSVKLGGTQDDWVRLLDKVDGFKGEFPALTSYFAHVANIIRKCINVFEDSIDRAFWLDMYRHEKTDSSIGGWLANLLNGEDGKLSTHITSVDFIWEYMGTKYNMKFASGINSYRVDEDGYLEPTLGYSVFGPLE